MAIYHVSQATGNDSNAGTSWAAAWKKITKAQQVARAGDTIWVRDGIYEQKLDINYNGQRWLADPGHTPILDGKYHDGLSDFSLIDKPAGTYVVQKNASSISRR